MDQPDSKVSRGCFVAAGIVQMVTAAAHTAAQLLGEDPPRTDQERQLMDLMRAVRIEFPLTPRTWVEVFRGFGWHFSFSLLAIGVLGLVVTRGRPAARRAFAGVAALAMVAMTANSVIYFFIVPTAFMGLTALLYAAAFVTAPRAAGTTGVVS